MRRRFSDQPLGSTWSLNEARADTRASGSGDGEAGRSTVDDGGRVLRTVLPSGLRVITERLPTMRSVTVGAWVDVGSRDETPSLAGATHYLEHMVFKGTRAREAAEISRAVESRGGDLNAFTTKEYTCYHAQVLDADLDVALDVVCDLVTSALLRSSDVDLERPVVLEEIAMHADDPSDAVHELIHEAMWSQTRLGRPVIGTNESVSALSAAQLRRWYRTRYVPSRVVVAAAGNLRHDDVVGMASRAFARLEHSRAVPEAAPAEVRPAGRPPTARRRTLVSERETEQANLAVAFPSVGRNHEQRHLYSLLSVILGGGMSSRLFQEVREERGLAYHVSTFQSRYSDTGMFGVQVGTAPDKTPDVLAVVRDVLADVAANGVTAAELEHGKGQMRGAIVIGMEDTASRMTRLATADLVHGYLMTVDDMLDRVGSVTLDQINDVAARLLSGQPAVAVVGRVDGGSIPSQ